jgi:hypothetical protein
MRRSRTPPGVAWRIAPAPPSRRAAGGTGTRTADRLDLGLPGRDGWEVLDAIRELSEVPVVLGDAQTAGGAREVTGALQRFAVWHDGQFGRTLTR